MNIVTTTVGFRRCEIPPDPEKARDFLKSKINLAFEISKRSGGSETIDFSMETYGSFGDGRLIRLRQKVEMDSNGLPQATADGQSIIEEWP